MNERGPDFERLQRFARQADQSAFADVVRRHLDLVFATALRKLEDHGAAQEIAQNVFAALARKAWQFAPDDSLPAWLHKTALFQSNGWLRGGGRGGEGGVAVRPADVGQESWRAWLPGVSSIAAGSHHTVALRSEGTLWAWGNNRSGQLGNGTFDTNIPSSGTHTP